MEITLVMDKEEIAWIIIGVGTVILSLVAYGKISADKITNNLAILLGYTLVNFFVSLAIGWIILPFDKFLEWLTSYSLKDIYVIEEELTFDKISLRVSITAFAIIEFIIATKYF